MLCSQLVTEVLELLHVLLVLFTLLVPGELELIDAFKHMSSALLLCFELTEVEMAASERRLRCLCTSSGRLINSLEADESEAKEMLTALLLGFFIQLPVLHQLHVSYITEGGEEFEEFFLCVLDAHDWIQWEASEVEVVASHLLLVLESLQTEVGLTCLLLQSRNDVQPWFSIYLFTFLAFFMVIVSVLEVFEGLPCIFLLGKADEAEAFRLPCFVVLVFC